MSREESDGKDELREEYDLETLLEGAVQGKHAPGGAGHRTAILLEPDVAEAFPDAASVNAALRLVIEAAKLARPGP
jgi:hypothetical protein